MWLWGGRWTEHGRKRGQPHDLGPREATAVCGQTQERFTGDGPEGWVGTAAPVKPRLSSRCERAIQISGLALGLFKLLLNTIE